MTNNERYIAGIIVLLHYCATMNTAFVTTKSRAYRTPSFATCGKTYSPPLYATRQEEATTTSAVEEKEDDRLSELDARVLNSMLTDEKLDLETEGNMRKLLERGVAPKTPDLPPMEKNIDDDDDGKYSSTLFKTLANDGIWNSVKAKAGKVLESVQIFVANRVERDAKLLAAVGLFAWDRAVRDVARALPESGTSGARAMRNAVRQLSNTSSFQENTRVVEDLDLYEELNTPMDEIRSVTQSILDILTEKDVRGGRGLRTVAPAGQAKNAERQRRAFQRTKQTKLKREKEGIDKKLGRAAGGVADAAWEMKREMQVETNRPGYRTENARKAIEAGATQTAKVLQAAKEEPGGWKRILFGEPTKEKMPAINAKVADIPIPVSEDLLNERSRVIESLRNCLDAPDDTWLVPDVLSGCVSDGEGCPVDIDDNVLREVVTGMICLRDDLEGADEVHSAREEDLEEVINELKRIRGTIESIVSLASVAAGYKAADSLRTVLYGEDDDPVLLRLDDLEAATHSAPNEPITVEKTVTIEEPFAATATAATDAPPSAERNGMWFADNQVTSNGASQAEAVEAVVIPEVLDASFQANVIEVNGNRQNGQTVNARNMAVEIGDGVNMEVETSLAVEIVSDEDFEEAFGAAKSTSVVSDDEAENEENQIEQEESLLAKVTLRTLDIVVFVAEKIFTVGLPGIFTVGKTASSRLAQVGRDGLGSKGWKKLGNVKDGSKRY